MTNIKNIPVTLREAREWYNGDNAILKKLALKAFSEEALRTFDFTKIKSFNDALDALGIEFFEKKQVFNMIRNVSNYSKASAAMFKLNIIRKALNKGYDIHLAKNINNQSSIWYPYFRFITEDCTCYNSELKSGTLEKIGKITSEGVIYDVLGGDTNDGGAAGLGYFYSRNGVGYANADIGFLGCATEDIARHFGKYFGMLVIEAMYSDMIEICRKYN